MAKAKRQIDEVKKDVDLFINVLDSRIPRTSFNHHLVDLIGKKPQLLVLTRKHQSDLVKLAKMENELNQIAPWLAVDLDDPQAAKQISRKIQRVLKVKSIGLPKIFVVGLPNVGKSRLINTLVGRASAPVARLAGKTRGRQVLKTKWAWIFDNPGVLWPEASDYLTATKLAVLGLVGTKAVDQKSAFFNAYQLISKLYPDKIKSLDLTPAQTENEVNQNLIQYAKNRGFYQKEGQVDLSRTYQSFFKWIQNLTGLMLD
ncbi:GTPase [Mycoplasma sp. ATU-Cv-703]|uniref:GTPase n=1 Tax=Mycoplasma sp. ATU-Cv-703 TaxID=2498595 RepID=UPI001374A591